MGDLLILACFQRQEWIGVNIMVLDKRGCLQKESIIFPQPGTALAKCHFRWESLLSTNPTSVMISPVQPHQPNTP